MTNSSEFLFFKWVKMGILITVNHSNPHWAQWHWLYVFLKRSNLISWLMWGSCSTLFPFLLVRFLFLTFQKKSLFHSFNSSILFSPSMKNSTNSYDIPQVPSPNLIYYILEWIHEGHLGEKRARNMSFNFVKLNWNFRGQSPLLKSLFILRLL